ncbi:MAG: molybdenum cofactor guanylyltransferase [Candidatus Binatia bacterium]|nr:molybdenum cofactor guanylyltransferase [Candidatus Binatia bacterium]
MRISCVSAVILAGGRSSRMGGLDKAFMRVGGKPAIERTVGLLQELFEEIIVVTNNPEKYARLCGVHLTRDVFLGKGPLAGFHAGLARARYPYCFVVACDMPFLRREPITFLHSLTRGFDAVVPVWEGDVEPLHAFYATRLVDLAGSLLTSGSYGLRSLLSRITVRYVDEEEMRAVPGSEEAFRNVNTPADALRYAVEL